MKISIDGKVLQNLQQSKKQFEIGLLVALKREDNEYVVRYFVKTPEEDKPIDNLFALSSDWFQNHAYQVSTMINASHIIVGMYTFGDSANVNKRSDVITLFMKSIPLVNDNNRTLVHLHVEET
jgi:hypothetical protein